MRRSTRQPYRGRLIHARHRPQIAGNAALEAKFANLLALARRVREQQQRQRRPKVYSLHAPEVECIGKGKVHRPYEFGVKVSAATTLSHAMRRRVLIAPPDASVRPPARARLAWPFLR